jgi:peptidoglycan/LPS O-acetylase OafA/YrhL
VTPGPPAPDTFTTSGATEKVDRTAVATPDAVAPPPGNPRFPLFDGLRAMAALSILVYHTGIDSQAAVGEAGLSPYVARMNVGVAIFFVISGFLLYRPFVAARIGAAPSIRVRDYARRRVLRIVPAYWVAVTVLAIYPGLPGVFTGRWWVYYGFGQGYSRSTVLNGIGPAWSLGCEVIFYALLPVLSVALGSVAVRTRRARWWRAELAALTVLALASFGWRAYADAHPAVPQYTIAGTFAWFALGMALAVASVALAGSESPWPGRIARYGWVGWLAALAAFLVICRGLGLGGGFVFFQHVSTAQDLGIYALSGVVAAGLALPAVFERGPRGAIGRFLGAPIVAWLGLISYGIFLYHGPIAYALNGGVNGAGDAALRFLWLTTATAAIAIAAAAASYYLVERPFLRLKEWRLRPATVSRSAAESLVKDPAIDYPADG